MDSIRKKVDYYTHTIWGRWICNALVAVCALIAMKALLEYGLTFKHSLLFDQLANRKIEVEAFAKYAPLVVAGVTFLLPGFGPVAVGLVLWLTSFAVCPYLISFATLALMFAAPTNKIVKALVTLMPVAIMQFTPEQMDKLGATNALMTVGFGICLMFVIAYASHMADKVTYAMSTPILFAALAVPAGFFGKFKHINLMKAYWLKDKTFGYFKEGIDKYTFDHLQSLLIILVALLVVVIVFTVLLTTKKTALAKMSRDKRDAIVFAVTTVLLVGVLVGLKSGLKLETMEVNYLMVVVQMIIAFIATRFIAKHDESLNVADDEKLKKFSKFTSILSILAIVAGIGFGGYYYYQHKDDVSYNTMEGAIECIYDEENDIIDVYPLVELKEDVDCIWFKFTNRTDCRKCANVQFEIEEDRDIVKDAYLYDKTGENEVVDFIMWEGVHQTWDFPASKGEEFYIKVDLQDVAEGDKIHVMIFPNN